MAAPQNADPGDVWARVCALPRPLKVIDFPRKDPITGDPIGKIGLWVLRQEEIIQAQAEATTFVRELVKGKVLEGEFVEGYRQAWENAAATEILFRCARRAPTDKEPVPDGKHPFFPQREAARKLTADEIAVLMEAYSVHQAESGPIVAHMSDDEMKGWVRLLKEGGSRSPLGSLSRGALTDLTYFLASRLASFWTDTSSPGSRLDSGTSNPSPSSDLSMTGSPPDGTPPDGPSASSGESESNTPTNS